MMLGIRKLGVGNINVRTGRGDVQIFCVRGKRKSLFDLPSER